MKKPYQIESQRAVRRLEEMAADGNPAVQMVLPLAEMVGWLRKGVGELIRQAGLQLMELLMEQEVRELVGERSRQQPDRRASRWGKERGFCVVMGQKVPVERPRVRTTDDQEVRLGSYEMFHRGEPLTETVWEKLMLGLSTRKYGQAVREFSEAYGLEKSAISEHFIEASRVKLKEMMERRLDKVKLCALLIDATPFAGQQMVAALGISQDGRKTILGIRQGATENATVVGELLGDLVNRGLDFSEPRLYVLDGGKALHAAVKKYAGESAPIQRCQVHKRRNVLDHLTTMFTSGQLNKRRALRRGAGQILKVVSSSNGCKRPIVVAPRIERRNSNGEWNPWRSSWSARWQRSNACESKWKKRCGPTSEVPHRFPRENPRATPSRPDVSLAPRMDSGLRDRFPTGWMSKSTWRCPRAARTVTARSF